MKPDLGVVLPPLDRLLEALLLEVPPRDEFAELLLGAPLLKLDFGGLIMIGPLLDLPLLREELLREILLEPLGGVPFWNVGFPELIWPVRSELPLRETLLEPLPLRRLFSVAPKLPSLGLLLLCGAEPEPPRFSRPDGDGPKLLPERGVLNSPALPPEGWPPDGLLLPSKDGRGRFSNPLGLDGGWLLEPDPRLKSPLRISGRMTGLPDDALPGLRERSPGFPNRLVKSPEPRSGRKLPPRA